MTSYISTAKRNYELKKKSKAEIDTPITLKVYLQLSRKYLKFYIDIPESEPN